MSCSDATVRLERKAHLEQGFDPWGLLGSCVQLFLSIGCLRGLINSHASNHIDPALR